MYDRYQGDPRIVIGPNGSYLKISGGQPVMDQGIENIVILSLFADSEWWGNLAFRDKNKKIGSKFEKITREPLTVSLLSKIENYVKSSLQHMIDGGIASEILVFAKNPRSDNLNISIMIRPPSGNIETLLLARHGTNWIAQKEHPANERL